MIPSATLYERFKVTQKLVLSIRFVAFNDPSVNLKYRLEVLAVQTKLGAIFVNENKSSLQQS